MDTSLKTVNGVPFAPSDGALVDLSRGSGFFCFFRARLCDAWTLFRACHGCCLVVLGAPLTIFLVRAWYRSARGPRFSTQIRFPGTVAFRNFLGKGTSVALLSLFISSESSNACCFSFLLRGIFTSFGCDAADLSRAGQSAALLSRAWEEEEPHQRGVRG